jgi:phosphoribosylanthranilate isomerase
MSRHGRTWVKVCGLTREVDVAAAVDAGADAVGFIIAERSPRMITLDRARDLAGDVPVQAVLVSADLTPAEVLATARSAGIDGVQPHGRHAYAAAAAAVDAGFFVLQPAPVSRPFVAPPIAAGALALFDTADPDRHGGTGRTFQWDLVAEFPDDFVMAGGLHPGNVAAAVAAAGPFGVDASSGLEHEVGIKDHSKVAAFIQEAKTA